MFISWLTGNPVYGSGVCFIFSKYIILYWNGKLVYSICFFSSFYQGKRGRRLINNDTNYPLLIIRFLLYVFFILFIILFSFHTIYIYMKSKAKMHIESILECDEKESKIMEISTFHILAIGRLLWETLYLPKHYTILVIS